MTFGSGCTWTDGEIALIQEAVDQRKGVTKMLCSKIRNHSRENIARKYYEIRK